MIFSNAIGILGWPVVTETAGRPAFPEPNVARDRHQARVTDRDGVSEQDTTHDDAQMADVARGDAGAFRSLSDRHLTGIVRYATRMLGSQNEAEDVAQETFLRLWRDAGRYEARGFKVSTWLYRVAHNLCVDRLRQRRPARDLPAELASRDRTSRPLADKELAAHVSAALERLPERQRAAIALVHYEEKSHEEAGLILGCGVEAVESLLSRARRALRESLASLRDGGAST